MSDDELERKLAYYRRRLDDGAGKLVQADYRISHLKHALEQRRRGFALLAEFQQTISGITKRDEVVRAIAEALIGSIGMNRTVVYERQAEGFAPSVLFGFEAGAALPPLAQSVVDADRPVLVTRATKVDAPGVTLLAELGMTSCACVPLRDDGSTFAILVTGRVKEMLPLYPPLDEVDVETLVVISASIGAALQTRRVAVLRELDQLRMDFFANISHEFRTPITLTLAPIEGMLSGRAGALPDTAEEQLRMMQRNQRKLLGLVNQILDLSKIEAGRAALNISPHGDVPALVQSIARGFDELARARSLSLDLAGEPQPSGVVVPLDVEMFDRMLVNVLANAVKFTSSGGVTVRWRFTPSHLHLSVRDTGIGIDAADLPSIFDRFQRSASAKHHTGTGIGLSLVKEIVDLHGGKVHVESIRGVGTTFEFSFVTSVSAAVLEAPLPTRSRSLFAPSIESSEGDDATEVAEWNGRAARAHKGQRATVLYVDDNRDLRAHVGALFEGEFNTFLACDGEEAMALLRERPFDLVLSDVMMPRVDGVELCRRVRADHALRHLPFVLLTAKIGDADRLAALDLGADDYLAKPFSQAELLARVRNLLRIRALQLQTERDITVARSIQHAVLPPRHVRFAAGYVEHLYEPCEALSGDFCDVLEAGGDVVFYVADVTGHGIASAQVTYLVREAFRRRLREGDALETLLVAVADDYRRFGLGFDVSTHVALLRGRRLSLCRVGAPLAVLVRAGVAEVIAAPPSLSLAALCVEALHVVSLDLAPGDQVFLFSDGVLELTMAGRVLGLRRLRDHLCAAAGLDDWRSGLLALFAAARRAGELHDDITVLRLVV